MFAMHGKRKRHWFQIHLSTAVMMTILLGTLLLINSLERVSQEFASVAPLPAFHITVIGNGWPYIFHNFRQTGPVAFQPNSSIEKFALILDMLFGAAVLAAAALLSESIIRRREGRKP